MQPSDKAIKPRYYSPRWFVALWRGRLSFGDTFFGGVFGPAFILVPVGFVIALAVEMLAPALMGALFLAFALVYALYVSALLPAVVQTGWRAKVVGGWRWVGILLVLAVAAALWWMAYKYWLAL